MALTMFFLVFLVGFGSGLVGAYAGGASLISIPFLIFIGIPPDIAIATNRVAQTGLTVAIIMRFLRSDKIQWRYVPFFSLLAIIGGFIGAHVLASVSPQILQHILGGIILVFVPLMLWNNRLIAEKTEVTHKAWHLWVGYFCYFLIMIFGGFLGGGSMIMMALVTTAFFGFSILQANATNNVSWLLLCFSAVYVFIHKGLVDWPVAGVLLVGTSLGGYCGAHFAIAQGEKVVRKVFIVISSISGLVLLLK